MTRGIKREVDEWILDMQAQWFKLKQKVKNEKGEWVEKDAFVRGGLRPFQLWEYVFPKESLNEVCNSLEIAELEPKYKSLEKYFFFLRKLLKAKPVPKIPTTPMRLIYHQNISILPIGIKEDEEEVLHAAGFKSEAL